MTRRVDLFKTQPALAKAMSDFSHQADALSLDKTLKHLVFIYSSYLNKCAFCLDMHVKEAKIDGERELRMMHIPVWRESQLFTENEKLVFELTHVLTKLGEEGISDSLYEKLTHHFSADEIGQLIYLIVIINSWNRIMIASKIKPGSFDKLYGLEKANLS
ncbi:alkylhydroperoxidase AhpD family core domain-containing protein [Bartonella tamiae Th307]|uniref:Alkylhydroperoxidase AhpD family core domain-containing protein n=2 Tax=Bartonella tamiae TaxID=373638 RepID=J1JVV0_9HYPH|nr:alkylhydroperoxidase AhpD family core domain-containing protein [Bartonella tamiae Th239]EJF95495.1 alkylhydroperoxidase AhpD family core domain-containing protein [Bartonella tamiae Th307]